MKELVEKNNIFKKVNFKKINLKEILPWFKKCYAKFKKLSLKKKAIVVIIIIALIFVIKNVFSFKAKEQEYTIEEYNVKKGNISVVLTGTSTVNPINQYDVVSLVKGEIIEDSLNVGDVINEGDVLYKIDSKEAQNNIAKAQLSYEKSKLSYDQTKEQADNLIIKAPVSGIISQMNIEEGSNINTNTKIAEIIDYSNLTLTIPFLASDAKCIYNGENAKVVISETGTEYVGTVTKVYSGDYVTTSGALVSDIEIEFNNPGTILEGAKAVALVDNYACNAEGNIKYENKYQLASKTSGEVVKINYKSGDSVKKGDIIAVVENSSLVVNTKSSSLSLQDSYLNIQDMYDTLDDYTIKSPINGTVIQKTYKAGDTIDGTNNKETLAVIADMSKLVFTLNIDELDISSVKVGQTAVITADALPNKKFYGTVDTVSIIGTTQNNATSYPVDIVISEYEGLIPGMSVNAEIVTQEAKDVLIIPISAVERGNRVLVSEKSESAKVKDTTEAEKQNSNDTEEDKLKNRSKRFESTVAGFKYVTVTTGVTDENYVEITSGLNEGDLIAYKVATAAKGTTDTTTTSNMGNPGMMGGMPGGMQGGMSSGMSGNRTSTGGNNIRNNTTRSYSK